MRCILYERELSVYLNKSEQGVCRSRRFQNRQQFYATAIQRSNSVKQLCSPGHGVGHKIPPLGFLLNPCPSLKTSCLSKRQPILSASQLEIRAIYIASWKEKASYARRSLRGHKPIGKRGMNGQVSAKVPRRSLFRWSFKCYTDLLVPLVLFNFSPVAAGPTAAAHLQPRGLMHPPFG